MRANPKNDWNIADVKTLCKQVGLMIVKPTGGSHYQVYSDHLHGMQIVPYRRPIKTIYIKRCVSLADAHLRAVKAKGKG